MDLPKFHPNERVDLGDVEFLSDGQLGEFQRLFNNLVTGDATTRILDGFTWTIQSSTVLQVALGKAVLAENRNAAIRYGQLVGGGAPLEGVATQNVSFSGLAIGTWGVFVRFVYGDGAVQNRAFWDTITDLEEIQAVNTRKVAGWQIAVAQNAPGAEWYKVVDVAWDGANLNTSTFTDRRAFLFEGPADSSPQTFRPTWGGGSDRNAARATNGVKTLERFASAVLKKIEEIQSDTPTTRWWDAPAEPLSKKVSRFGDLTLAGNYSIAGNLTMTGSSPDILTQFSSVGVGPTLRYEFTGNPASYYWQFSYSQLDGEASYDVGPGIDGLRGHRWTTNGTTRMELHPTAGGGLEVYVNAAITGSLTVSSTVGVNGLLSANSSLDVTSGTLNALNGVESHLWEKVTLGEGALGSHTEAFKARMTAKFFGTHYNAAPFRFGYTKLLSLDGVGANTNGEPSTAMYADSSGGLVFATNAVWNPATGQWSQPAANESIRIRIGGGVFEVQTRESGSAAWNDEDWGGGFAGAYWDCGSDHKPRLISVGSAEFSGHIQAGAPPAAPQRSALYSDNVVQGWATLICDGAGGITIQESFNVSGASINVNNDIVVSWDTDLVANKYGCVVTELINPAGTDGSEGLAFAVRSNTAGSAVIAASRWTGGVLAAVNFATGPFRLTVIAIGTRF